MLDHLIHARPAEGQPKPGRDMMHPLDQFAGQLGLIGQRLFHKGHEELLLHRRHAHDVLDHRQIDRGPDHPVDARQVDRATAQCRGKFPGVARGLAGLGHGR